MSITILFFIYFVMVERVVPVVMVLVVAGLIAMMIMDRELRDNLLGPKAWGALEPTTRWLGERPGNTKRRHTLTYADILSHLPDHDQTTKC